MNYQESLKRAIEAAEHRRAMIAGLEQHIIDHYGLPGMRAKDMATVMFNRNLDPRIEDDVVAAMRMVGVKHEGF